MNRATFLSRLRDGLTGLPKREIDDIIADYTAHFTDGAAAGRSEDEVAEALGDPARLAKELRAEIELRRWREHQNPSNFLGALFAFIGLATVDLIVLLPLLFTVALVLFIFGVVLVVLLMVGLALVASMLIPGLFGSFPGAIVRGLAGIGLVAGGVGGGALLLIFLDVLVRILAMYARLHYRVLSPANQAA